MATILRTKSYDELLKYDSFESRFSYLKLIGSVGESTFGHDRFLNQALYTSSRWLKTRRGIIIRDNGCDLGIPGYEIRSKIVIHHMNPISPEEIEHQDDSIFDPQYLICVSENTHRAIHFGDKSLLPERPIIRRPGDTSPWRRF